LTADDEEARVQDPDLCGQPVLQARFDIEPLPEAFGKLAVLANLPDSDFYRHVTPRRWY